MREKIITLTLFLISLSCSGQEKIQIGGYTYYKKQPVSAFLKDDGFTSKYSVYETEDGNHRFGCEMESTRNDSVFRKGIMEVDYKNKTVLCKELYFYNQSRKVDSIFSFYKQLKDGSFKTVRIIEYKNGISKLQYP